MIKTEWLFPRSWWGTFAVAMPRKRKPAARSSGRTRRWARPGCRVECFLWFSEQFQSFFLENVWRLENFLYLCRWNKHWMCGLTLQTSIRCRHPVLILLSHGLLNIGIDYGISSRWVLYGLFQRHSRKSPAHFCWLFDNNRIA